MATEHFKLQYPYAESLDYETYYRDAAYNRMRRCKLMLFGQCLGDACPSVQDRLRGDLIRAKKTDVESIMPGLGIGSDATIKEVCDYLYPSVVSRARLVKNLERGCMNRSIRKAREYNIRCVWNNEAFTNLYNDICYKLAANLDVESPVHSNHLRRKLLDGSINPIDVADISSRDLCPKLVEKLENKISLRTNMERKIKFSELYRCKRCKKTKCTTERIYNRGLDEGVSESVRCLVCGFSWIE